MSCFVFLMGLLVRNNDDSSTNKLAKTCDKQVGERGSTKSGARPDCLQSGVCFSALGP